MCFLVCMPHIACLSQLSAPFTHYYYKHFAQCFCVLLLPTYARTPTTSSHKILRWLLLTLTIQGLIPLRSTSPSLQQLHPLLPTLQHLPPALLIWRLSSSPCNRAKSARSAKLYVYATVLQMFPFVRRHGYSAQTPTNR